jgi:lipopolysaccharide export LptBFGC system permease protein LptF
MRSAHSHILGFTKFDRYLSFQILKAVLAVTMGFTALVSMFAFLEELSDAAHGYQLTEIAIFVLSSTPRRLGEVLIFSTFMGCLIALGELAENGEIQAVRLIGASPWRLLERIRYS